MNDLPLLLHALTYDHADTGLLSHAHLLRGVVPFESEVALVVRLVLVAIPDLIVQILLARRRDRVLQDHLLQLAGFLIEVLDQFGLLQVRQLRWPVTDASGRVNLVDAMVVSQSVLENQQLIVFSLCSVILYKLWQVLKLICIFPHCLNFGGGCDLGLVQLLLMDSWLQVNQARLELLCSQLLS